MVIDKVKQDNAHLNLEKDNKTFIERLENLLIRQKDSTVSLTGSKDQMKVEETGQNYRHTVGYITIPIMT